MSALAPIVVDLGKRSYAVHVGRGGIDAIGERLRALGNIASRVAVVSNPTVGRLYGARVRASLAAAGFGVTTIDIPDGEEHKNLAWLAFVYEKLIEARIERGAALIALGGGVIGDLTGFAAATYLRGIPFVQVPTTLVAQIDASIGGKTAVNLAAGKNLIGSFHQPRMVVVDPTALTSLPDREYVAGLAEVVKTGAILSAELFEQIEADPARLLEREPALVDDVVRQCVRLKALVVSADEAESDYRAILNFGHTLGHAIEALMEYRGVLHGEAVSIGMAFAVGLSVERGWLAPDVGRRITALLEGLGLPTAVPAGLAPGALALAIEADKKRSEGRVRFVCLEALGRTRFEMLSTDDLERALRSLRVGVG